MNLVSSVALILSSGHQREVYSGDWAMGGGAWLEKYNQGTW